MTRIDGNMALLLHKVLQLLWKEINKEASFHVFNLYITEKKYTARRKTIFKTPANIWSFFFAKYFT